MHPLLKCFVLICVSICLCMGIFEHDCSCLLSPEEDTELHGAGVTCGYAPHPQYCKCWHPNSDPLLKQEMLLTLEPSLHLLLSFFMAYTCIYIYIHTHIFIYTHIYTYIRNLYVTLHKYVHCIAVKI